MKLNWLQKIERGMFPRGPEYVVKRKPVDEDGKPFRTYRPSGNSHQRRKFRRFEDRLGLAAACAALKDHKAGSEE